MNSNKDYFCTENKMSAPEILNSITNHLKISTADLSEQIGYDRPQTLYDVINGKTKG